MLVAFSAKHLRRTQIRSSPMFRWWSVEGQSLGLGSLAPTLPKQMRGSENVLDVLIYGGYEAPLQLDYSPGNRRHRRVSVFCAVACRSNSETRSSISSISIALAPWFRMQSAARTSPAPLTAPGQSRDMKSLKRRIRWLEQRTRVEADCPQSRVRKHPSPPGLLHRRPSRAYQFFGSCLKPSSIQI